jgi:hypothetical protein
MALSDFNGIRTPNTQYWNLGIKVPEAYWYFDVLKNATYATVIINQKSYANCTLFE